ncbi:hypothetical protein CDAR_429191 [Caerostris darwini]|uniref:Uncharacterized protein n=1 Tax=Caerostris darwini TaxID=1538125 RepID=A0AAV4TD39_9ARAC|nr:hypothetical protein CDAR_429191 [Caerostris darwini]
MEELLFRISFLVLSLSVAFICFFSGVLFPERQGKGNVLLQIDLPICVSCSPCKSGSSPFDDRKKKKQLNKRRDRVRKETAASFCPEKRDGTIILSDSMALRA